MYTASLEFDGQTNDWFYEYSDDGGATTDHGVVLFGPEYNTKGSPTYPTNNRLQKGNGDHHIVDSSITDNGTTVSTSLPFTSTQITASSGFKGNLVGNVTGTATTASYVEGSNVDGTVANATSASFAVSASHVEFADVSRTSTSASYAVSASHVEFADSAKSASYAISASHVEFSDNSRDSVSSSFALTASYALNVDPTDTGSLLTTASAAANIITFTKGDSSTFQITIATGSAESASFAASASHAEFADVSRTSTSASYATTASYSIGATTFANCIVCFILQMLIIPFGMNSAYKFIFKLQEAYYLLQCRRFKCNRFLLRRWHNIISSNYRICNYCFFCNKCFPCRIF